MYKVILFVYDFPHKKSEDFIHVAKSRGLDVVGCIGAPRKKLNLPQKVYERSLIPKPIFHPRDLCRYYGYDYIRADHNSREAIEFIKVKDANLGIIAGARILKKSTIDAFRYGIVNFHPGKIPEASGLFALYWSILKGISPYVTTHFIDERIDAGNVIFEKKIEIHYLDRIEDVEYKIYQTQLEEFEHLIEEFLSRGYEIPSHRVEGYIDRNPPMEEDLQWKAIGMFEKWKEDIVKERR